MENYMLVFFAPDGKLKASQCYRLGTAALTFYIFFLNYQLLITNTEDEKNLSSKNSDTQKYPHNTFLEFSVLNMAIAGSLFMLPAILKPCIEYRSYLLPGILLSVYILIAYLFNGSVVAASLMHGDRQENDDSGVVEFLASFSLTILIGFFLLHCALSFYNGLRPEFLTEANLQATLNAGLHGGSAAFCCVLDEQGNAREVEDY